MVEDISNQRKLKANVCQTFLIDRFDFAPRFLRRNIKYILDAHDRLLRQDPNESPHEDMIANEKRYWGWDFPTTAMLEDFMTGDKPILQLASLQLRRQGSKARIQKRSREQPVDSNGLGWLPNPEADVIWPCIVSVSVFNVQSSKRQVHFESLPAKILQSRGNNGSAEFDIHLDRPFFIEISKLYVVTDSGNNGSRSWKRTTTTPYLLEITVQCQDSDDSADFLSRVEAKDISAYENTPGSEGVIKATWEALPKCPVDGQLLTLRRAKGHKSLELDYKIEVAMGWIRRRDYRLKMYNKLYETKRQNTRQLLTPSASDDMEKTAKRYRILWKFRGGSDARAILVKSLSCPLCRDDRDYVYFDRLMLHCKNHHSHFHCEPEYPQQQDSATFHATVSLTVAAQSLETLNDEEDKEINWVAPDRPFNLKAHLRNEDNWTKQGKSKSKKGPAKLPKDRSFSSAPPQVPSRKRPAPDEVEDLPRHTAKRHCVPYVPGVSFYRTTSKQLILPGEYIAESDDDVEEAWLTQREGRALENLGITGAAKDFTKAFNQHLASEQSDSSLLVRDALVRFARSYKDKLRDVQWQREFRAKLNQLQMGGIVADDIVSACIQLLPSPMQIQRNVTQEPIVSGETEMDALNENTDRTNKASERQNQVDGENLTGHERGGETQNSGRSTSIENGRPLQRERRKWTGGKTVLRDAALSNGDVRSRTTDVPQDSRRTPNGVASHRER